MPFHNAQNHAESSRSLADPTYTGDLGDGLVCRWSTGADLDKIMDLYATVFREDDEPLNRGAGDEARVFMSEGFPLMGAEDFALVEDTSQPERPIVAATSFWRRQWSYGGILFGVGQPENVATLAAYRNRGLVRALFDMFHARSAAAGHLAQAITGIRYFYRQFGYEYVLDLGGHRAVPLASIPAKADSEPEPYALRPATLDDMPDLQTLYNQRRAASLVWHETDDAFWRYHVTGWDDAAVQDRDPALVGLIGKLHMIVDGDGKTCGYAWLASKRWGRSQFVFALELFPHVNWQRAALSVAHFPPTGRADAAD
ncbi:MAG: GNAT family N-acetyltransferase [Caldilineaceae bacterium]